MSLYASFNYEPSNAALLAGASVALLELLVLARWRSVWVGCLAGGLGWGSIAWLAFGAGSGDMTSLIQVFYGCFFGIAGAVLGAAAGLAGKWRRKAPEGPDRADQE